MLRANPNAIRQAPAQTNGTYAVQQAAAIHEQVNTDSSRYLNRLNSEASTPTDPWQTRPQRPSGEPSSFRSASTFDGPQGTNATYQKAAPWQASSLSDVAMPDTEIPSSPLNQLPSPNGSPSLTQPIQSPPDSNSTPDFAKGGLSSPEFNAPNPQIPLDSDDQPPALEDYQAAPLSANQGKPALPEVPREQSVLVKEDDPSLNQALENSSNDENQLRDLSVEPTRTDLRGSNISRPVNNQFRNVPNRRTRNRRNSRPQEDELQRITEVDQSRGRKSCDAYRAELLNTPITDIVLDISPIRPVAAAQRTPVGLDRTWKDCSGKVLAKGKLLGLERSYILVDDESGQGRLISMADLSEVDLFVVTQYWGLPIECNLGCDTFQGRSWNEQSFFWKASALCHKPLYFENRALERYGHTHGPIVEPIHSAAHFFVNLIAWPYHTGINPPNECLYALGFYRPGDCAPWLRDPLPLSLNGAINQSLAIVAIGGIIP